MDQNPLLAAMQNYLASRNKIPAVGVLSNIPGQTGAFDWTEGPNGTMFIDPNGPGTTIPHETAHATHFELARQAGLPSVANSNPLPGDGSPQFKAAYSKLFGSLPQFTGKLAQSEPGLSAAQQEYRYSPHEAVAFGVGNQTPGVQERDLWRGGGHLDSTLATEMAILLELAQRKNK